MTREAQKAEAVERLKALGFDSELVSKFETDGTVFICDPPSGKPIPADSDTVKEIGKLEAEYGCLVYLVIRDYSFSFLDSLIIVSKYDEEWEFENDDLKDGYLMTYTINYLNPEFSEFGSIAYVHTKHGGIVRTA